MACDQIIDSYEGSNDLADAIILPGEYIGQAFTMGDTPHDICGAKFYMSSTHAGGTSIDMAARIYACTGTPGTDGEPTGSALATSDSIQYTGDKAEGWEEFTFSTPYTLLASTNYCIVLECLAVVDLLILIGVSFDNTSPTHGGNYCYNIGGTSSYNAGYDCNFFMYYGVAEYIRRIKIKNKKPTYRLTTEQPNPTHRLVLDNEKPTYRLTPENQKPTYRLIVEAQ